MNEWILNEWMNTEWINEWILNEWMNEYWSVYLKLFIVVSTWNMSTELDNESKTISIISHSTE